jgi:Winged helix DNA-binding domain
MNLCTLPFKTQESPPLNNFTTHNSQLTTHHSPFTIHHSPFKISSGLVMKFEDIPKLRLYNQHIMMPHYSEPGEIVKWLGAVQAQDYLGALWAIGLRLKGNTESTLEKAIENRKIVRSWPMRGTLHFVPAEDLRWMLTFLTPRVLQRSAGLYTQAGLDNKVLTKSGKVLSTALKGEQQLTRNEIYTVWERARISTAEQRGLHILGYLAQTGLICFGPRKGKQQTFVLVDEWLPSSKIPAKDEALASLALTYFQSHGPATIQDFSWWSGLTIAEGKKAVQSIGSKLEEQLVDGKTYYMLPAKQPQKASLHVFLLPNYDEYFVAYKDRSAALVPKSTKNIKQLGNGIFTSPIVINGLMAGYWKRRLVKDTIMVETNIFSTINKSSTASIEAAARKYGKFLKTPVAVSCKYV